MLYCRVRKLCKEDVLSTFYQYAVYFHCSAQSCLPERKIEYVVKSERNQQTLHQTVYPCSCITGFQNYVSYCINSGLDYRPDKVHQNTDSCVNQCGDDWNKSGTSEERKHLWQFDLIESIVQCRNTQTYDNTAEYTHLKGGDTTNGSGSTAQHLFGTAVNRDQCTDGCMHDEECDGSRKGCNLLFLLCHSDSYTHCKDYGQVGKYDITRFFHYIENIIDNRSRSDCIDETIGFEHGLVCERATESQQQSGYRKDGDWKHK